MIMEDRCICCGEIIPEGVQVCPKCLVARTKKIELKPCPFCGGEAVYRSVDYLVEPSGYVRCKNGCCTQHWYSPKDKAIELWNRRAQDGDV